MSSVRAGSSTTTIATGLQVVASPEEKAIRDFDGFKIAIPRSITCRVVVDDLPVLGRGGYAKVYKATWQGKTVAVKQLTSSKKGLGLFCDEAAKMRYINDYQLRCVPEFYAFYANEEEHCYQIIMQYVSGETLGSILARAPVPPRATALKLFSAVTAAAVEFAEHNLVHGDLKPANIMINEAGEAIFLDICLMIQLANAASTFLSFVCGTAPYIAPETIKSDAFSLATDMFAIGSIAYEMMTGHIPYVDADLTSAAVLLRVAAGQRDTIPEKCDPDFAAIVRQAWLQKPEDRPTIKSLHQSLEAMQNIETIGHPDGRVTFHL